MGNIVGQTDFTQWYSAEAQYYDSLIGVYGADSMDGTGYNNFMHDYYMWAPVLMPDKSMSSYRQQMMQNGLNYSANAEAAGTSPKWHLVGPDGDDAFPVFGYTGQIHYIYKNPHNNLEYFACSPTGGLFISHDKGEHWQNAGTDKGIPRCGVSSVVVDAQQAGKWFVVTGYGEKSPYRPAWQDAIGVYRTTDAGNTWQNISESNSELNNAPRMRKIIQVTADSTYLIVTASNGLWVSTTADAQYPVWYKLIDGEFYRENSTPQSQLSLRGLYHARLWIPEC